MMGGHKTQKQEPTGCGRAVPLSAQQEVLRQQMEGRVWGAGRELIWVVGLDLALWASFSDLSLYSWFMSFLQLPFSTAGSMVGS